MSSRNQIPLDAVLLPATRPTNFRRQPYSLAYTVLLILTTSVAGLFCYLYLSKPTYQISTMPKTLAPVTASAPPTAANPAPAAPPTSTPKAPVHGVWEETNLRVQHVLNAQTTNGRIDRIELTVPVLYQSRALLWTEQDVQTARLLHQKLSDHREKTKVLREEGQQLLAAWNQLVFSSMPKSILRADSPSLPSNQKGTPESFLSPDRTSESLIEVNTSEP